MHSPSFPPADPQSDASLPSTWSGRVPCPRFGGTIKALRLPAVPPAALSCLRLAVPRGAPGASLPRTQSQAPWAWSSLGAATPDAALARGNGQDLPSSRETPIAHSRMFFDPGRTARPSPWRCGSAAPARGTAKAPALGLSRFNSMAFGLAIYASPGGLPRRGARLASRCWLGFPGRAWLPAGFR
jgi:hypothetical protein